MNRYTTEWYNFSSTRGSHVQPPNNADERQFGAPHQWNPHLVQAEYPSTQLLAHYGPHSQNSSPNFPDPYPYYLPSNMISAPSPVSSMEPNQHGVTLSDFQSQERVSIRRLERETSSVSSIAPPQTTGYKRPSPVSPASDDHPLPKKPRKNKSNPVSKRAASSKKSEHVQIIDAQNALRLGQMFSDVNHNPESSTHFKSEIQNARCMSARYSALEELSKCMACTRRGKDDLCRFQGFRYLLKDVNTDRVRGVCFIGLEHHPARNDPPVFPKIWNEAPTLHSINKIKMALMHSLLPTLHEELRRMNQYANTMCYRPRESDCRATCDICLTSIFSSSWTCRLCGRDCCNDCYEVFSGNTAIPEHHTPGAHFLESQRQQFFRTHPSYAQCTKRNTHFPFHFVPVSRFRRSDLEEAIQDMEAMQPNPLPFTYPPPLQSSPKVQLDRMHSAAPHDQEDYVPPSMANCTTPHYAMPRYDFDKLTEPVFLKSWSHGIPIVVQGIAPRLKIPWGPIYFAENYGEKKCALWNCQSERSNESTVAEFFALFGQSQTLDSEGRPTLSLKLKDWPPSSDFKNEFKSEYEDFIKAVPMPSYTRPDGRLNIASMFPTNTLRPDLGPKMYNAQANFITSGSKGSTRLHMDMADAINIMAYASPDPRDSSRAGCAAWDIFLAEDSDSIRRFLLQHCVTEETADSGDPIHGQQHFLDETLRAQLYKETGVKSFRIYQRPGEAVFIPAGCAHQVCNLADCIKVAVDFVSPENISRCEQLTKEFRNLNVKAAWKEDVLQLKTMMWFAWLCCRDLETKIGNTEESPSSPKAQAIDGQCVRTTTPS